MKKRVILATAVATSLLLSSCGVLSPLLEDYYDVHFELNKSEAAHETIHDGSQSEHSTENDSNSHSSDHSGDSSEAEASAYSEDHDTMFSACLGDLEPLLDDAGYQDLLSKFDALWELRCARIASGTGTMTWQERSAMQSFSQLLDDYTDQLIGDFDSFFSDELEGKDYNPDGTDTEEDEPEEVELVDFAVNDDGTLGDATYYDEWADYSFTDEQIQSMWDTAKALLPEDALTVFDTYSIFTDGESETLAYVYWDFEDGNVDDVTWCIALDPADSEDSEDLQETLLHEYFHYLSLNQDQVDYEGEHTLETYAEDDFEIYSHPDSYLNQFYQAFWPGILVDERLSNPDSDYFFLRHYDHFYDDYAATDPSEDISECFSAYVLFRDGWYDDDDLEVWEQKIAWFDQFDELKDFRSQVRDRLGYSD